METRDFEVHGIHAQIVDVKARPNIVPRAALRAQSIQVRTYVDSVVASKRAPLIVTVTRQQVQWLDGQTWRVAKRKR